MLKNVPSSVEYLIVLETSSDKTNSMFKILAKLNKLLLPSFTKQGLDISKAKKWQMAIIGWKYYVTKNTLD